METAQYIHKHIALVEQCKVGDRKAQYELYRLYAKTMLNVCGRIVNHTAEAEDVLQEAFVEAFTKIESYKAQASFGSWLKQIVVNRAINHLRQRKMQWVDIEGIINDDYDIADAESYDDTEVEYEIEKVKYCLSKMPEGYRLVLSLYLFEGYDHEEISQILGISEATSRTQYMRGKQKLKEMFLHILN